MEHKIDFVIKNYDEWTDAQKTFADKIFEGDLSYLKDNISMIDDEYKKKSCMNSALCYSNNTDIIDFLLFGFDIDICSRTTIYVDIFADDIGGEMMEDNPSFINLACRYNKNLCVVKYFIEKHNFDPKSAQYGDNDDNDWLYEACAYGTDNLEVIRYLVEEKNMSLETIENCWYGSCYFNAALSRPSPDIKIISYIFNRIEEIKVLRSVIDSIKKLKINDLEELLTLVINNPDQIVNENNCHFFKVNLLFEVCFSNNYFSKSDKIYCLIKTTNPLAINENFWYIFKIDDPFEKEFNEFTKLVDSLTFCIEISSRFSSYTNNLVSNTEIKHTESEEDVQSTVMTKQERRRAIAQSRLFDYSQPSQQLFKHNNKIYYGDRDAVYKSMLFLNGIVDNCDFTDLFELYSDGLPNYAINAYISSSCTNTFDLDIINVDDIDHFIQFVDRYPTTVISINTMEDQIINYFDSNKITFSQNMRDIFIRYRLKRTYISMHNQLLLNKK